MDERCSRCFRQATRVVIGRWLNGRPVEEPVCDDHTPSDDEIGSERLYDTWHHTRHAPRRYVVSGIR